MSILVSAHELRKSFAARPLFDRLTFAIESGERVGLIGPNGAGKTTLLKILAGQTSPDEGTLSIQNGLRIGFLEQVPRFGAGGTVHSTVMEGARDPDDWQEIARAQEIMSRLSLSGTGEVSPETPIAQISGGWKKRVALARELVKQPDLLLLDEPTNHLDVESILWLEGFLARAGFATLTITHDRLFLQRVSNRILELDRRHVGGLLSVKGDYAAYLEIKDQLVTAQDAREIRLKNRLRRETEWLRQGAKARTTKQQARIQRAGELKSEVEELGYRNQVTRARIDFQGAERNPKKLVEARKITKSYGSKNGPKSEVLPVLDLVLTPKSRVGLLGPNGCGKSTLIRVLLGVEKPSSGEVIGSEHLKVSYFEQNRESLDPTVSLAKTLCPSGDYVDYRGGPVHIKSYLSRFLFSPEQMQMAVGKLSGGEQSRVLIAKLMLKECNLLVLDEPTNDLDMETLDVLQEVLDEFSGAVLLVTHDRYFLDQVASQILAFGVTPDGRKEIVPFAGLNQWESWIDERGRLKPAQQAAAKKSAAEAPAAKKRKLGFNEQRELDGMEEKIHAAEKLLARLTGECAQSEHASNSVRLSELTDQMSKAQAEVDRLYARWAELER